MPTFDRCQARYDAMLPRDFEVINEIETEEFDEVERSEPSFDTSNEPPYPFEAGHTWPLSDEEDDEEK